ncbi:hypothetical protein OFM21_31660, partial [Escherichia coli]|nr:hypothetical protein [Escherichia coli]
MSCAAIGLVARSGLVDNVWIHPAAGDAGGSLGGALFAWYQLMNNPRTPQFPDAQSGSFLGPRYSTGEIEAALKPFNAR